MRWKLAVFFVAAGMWLASLLTGQTWLTGVAIVVLLGGLALRGKRPQRDEAADY